MRNALAVGLLTLAVWMCVLDGPYRFDDHLVPLGDPASQSLEALVDHLTFTLRPLTKLTYALEASVGLADSAPARRSSRALLQQGPARYRGAGPVSTMQADPLVNCPQRLECATGAAPIGRPGRRRANARSAA